MKKQGHGTKRVTDLPGKSKEKSMPGNFLEITGKSPMICQWLPVPGT
jgi:hypothetical protein